MYFDIFYVIINDILWLLVYLLGLIIWYYLFWSKKIIMTTGHAIFINNRMIKLEYPIIFVNN
jgi:hypothetical protein